MKSEELMIGDWVKLKDGGPFQMEDVSGTNMFRRWTSDGEYMIPYGYDEIEPIPLTPEILEKNGFHFAKADRMSITDRYVWGVEGTRDGAIVEITFYNPDVHGVKVLTKIHTQSSHESGINSVHSCDIESVHELQRALRLYKIDKTIEL